MYLDITLYSYSTVFKVLGFVSFGYWRNDFMEHIIRPHTWAVIIYKFGDIFKYLQAVPCFERLDKVLARATGKPQAGNASHHQAGQPSARVPVRAYDDTIKL